MIEIAKQLRQHTINYQGHTGCIHNFINSAIVETLLTDGESSMGWLGQTVHVAIPDLAFSCRDFDAAFDELIQDGFIFFDQDDFVALKNK